QRAVLRRAGRPRDRARSGRAELRVFEYRRGRRRERAVPDAKRARGRGGTSRRGAGERRSPGRRAMTYITKRTLPRRAFLRAAGTATQSACDAGDCFYVNTVSWRNEMTPNLTENHPRLVFERLFGDGGSSAERLARVRKTSSILDSVREEARRLASSVGAGDRTKLDEYLDAVREVEQRIQSAESSGRHDVALPDRPTGIPASFEEHTKLMLDLVLLAFQTDTTRIFSLILAREVSNRSYPQIGVPDQHHPVSHHRNDPVLIEKKTKIDAYHVSFLGYLAEKMQATPEGDGTLLDQSLLMYGGGMGDGNLHRHNDLP